LVVVIVPLQKFKELMDKTCRGNLPCLATSGIYYVAVKSAAGNIFDRIQEQVVKENGRVKCRKIPNRRRSSTLTAISSSPTAVSSLSKPISSLLKLIANRPAQLLLT
jgi:hypothetical protein